MDGYNTYNRRDHYQPYVPPRQPGRRYDNRRFEIRRQEVNQFGLESLIKRPKEILATELQLQLPSCPPMIGTPKIENLDRYWDYHGEKGHYTNDCYQLKRQLEAALESKKLNHLVKDVRQRGNNRGRQARNNSTNGKVINMVYVMAEGKKRKCQREREEDWINVPITFPPIQSDDVSDELLIIEAEVEGYLVRRVFVDHGAAVQVMFEHCFRNLPIALQARLTQTHTKLVGFFGEQLLPIGVISVQYHIRADRNEGTPSRSIHNGMIIEDLKAGTGKERSNKRNMLSGKGRGIGRKCTNNFFPPDPNPMMCRMKALIIEDITWKGYLRPTGNRPYDIGKLRLIANPVLELVGFFWRTVAPHGVISVQYHIGADRNEGTLIRSIHNACNDEVPNLKRNCRVGSSNNGNFRMPTVGRKAYLTRRAAERKDGEEG
ncbi:hypothetical protein Tco_0820042 [Tanacetum coccineum]|uniref:Reverse transcriptase domain-containing protein n=1 Tax=Tanacetum coccineum TaxID=301880 RepID=A0ABQ5AC98_9ASTR